MNRLRRAVAAGCAQLIILVSGAGCSETPPAPEPEPAHAATSVAPPAANVTSPGANITTKLRGDLGPLYDLIAQGETGAARVRLRKRLDREPADGQAAFLFGLTYHREKRYALARPWFERAQRDAPDYVVTDYFRGWCLLYLGEPDGARAAFLSHLAAAPDEGDTHFGLGLLDLDDDRIDAAERRFRTAIARNEDRPDRIKELSKSHALLGEVLMRRGAWEQARDHLETATQLYPDHYAAHYRLYRVHLRLGADDAAEAAKAQFLAARRRVHPETRFPE